MRTAIQLIEGDQGIAKQNRHLVPLTLRRKRAEDFICRIPPRQRRRQSVIVHCVMATLLRLERRRSRRVRRLNGCPGFDMNQFPTWIETHSKWISPGLYNPDLTLEESSK